MAELSRDSEVRALRSALYDAVQMLDQAREHVERENRSLSVDPFAERLKITARRGRDALARGSR